MKKRLFEALLTAACKFYGVGYVKLINSQRKRVVLPDEVQKARGGFLFFAEKLVGDTMAASSVVGAHRGNASRYRQYFIENTDKAERLALYDAMQKELGVAFGQRRIMADRKEV